MVYTNLAPDRLFGYMEIEPLVSVWIKVVPKLKIFLSFKKVPDIVINRSFVVCYGEFKSAHKKTTGPVV